MLRVPSPRPPPQESGVSWRVPATLTPRPKPNACSTGSVRDKRGHVRWLFRGIRRAALHSLAGRIQECGRAPRQGTVLAHGRSAPAQCARRPNRPQVGTPPALRSVPLLVLDSRLRGNDALCAKRRWPSGRVRQGRPSRAAEGLVSDASGPLPWIPACAGMTRCRGNNALCAKRRWPSGPGAAGASEPCGRGTRVGRLRAASLDSRLRGNDALPRERRAVREAAVAERTRCGRGVCAVRQRDSCRTPPGRFPGFPPARE